MLALYYRAVYSHFDKEYGMLRYEDGIVEMAPGVYDPHGHPRVFDPITNFAFFEQNGYEGKAGLPIYTETAIKAGIAVISAMPNEFFRRIDPLDKDGTGTEIVQFPIASLDRATLMEVSLATQSRMLASFHLGLDKKDVLTDEEEHIDYFKMRANFQFAGVRATALKLFGDFSTGGQNIPIKHFPDIVSMWHGYWPEKPIIMHLENENVRNALEELSNTEEGMVAPIHIAHVSSREELEAVIWAKERGMNVTCEVTPHHLFTNATDGEQIGGYGCMKPTLKSADDVQFLWDNMRHIDIIASDCAPHRLSDKEAKDPTFGVTNHTVMMPLLLGAVDEGRITLEDLYQRTVVMPRIRFGLPEEDGTHSVFDMNRTFISAQQVEAEISPGYGHNIFPKLEEMGKSFHLLGNVVSVKSGRSSVKRRKNGSLKTDFKTSLEHFIAA